MPAKWREKAWEIASKLGVAPLKDAKKPVRWRGLGPTSTINTSATEATALGGPATGPRSRSSITSVESMLNSGFMNTVWTLSPRSVAEQPSLLLEGELPLEILETKDRDRLVNLADGIGCSVNEFAMEIIRFYVENDADILECGSVYDTIQFYLDNEIVG